MKGACVVVTEVVVLVVVKFCDALTLMVVVLSADAPPGSAAVAAGVMLPG